MESFQIIPNPNVTTHLQWSTSPLIVYFRYPIAVLDASGIANDKMPRGVGESHLKVKNNNMSKVYQAAFRDPSSFSDKFQGRPTSSWCPTSPSTGRVNVSKYNTRWESQVYGGNRYKKEIPKFEEQNASDQRTNLQDILATIVDAGMGGIPL